MFYELTCCDWTASNTLYNKVCLGCVENISNLSNTIIIDFEAVLFPARKLSNKKLKLSIKIIKIIKLANNNKY